MQMDAGSRGSANGKINITGKASQDAMPLGGAFYFLVLKKDNYFLKFYLFFGHLVSVSFCRVLWASAHAYQL